MINHDGFIEWRERFTQQVNRFDQVEQQLATLVANGVRMHSFADKEPTLEDVFMLVTKGAVA